MSVTTNNASEGSEAVKNVRLRRREDARDLALLIYDIFKENGESGSVNNGQNYANQNNSTD